MSNYYAVIENEYNKFKTVCDRYGFRTKLIFDQIHIITKNEEWYFVPNEENRQQITLMHKNASSTLSNLKKDLFHKQFHRNISYPRLVKYIAEHQDYKYEQDRVEVLFAKLANC